MFKSTIIVALLCAKSVLCLVPGLMGIPPMPGNIFGQQQMPQETFTCINRDLQDPSHQIRLTFTEVQPAMGIGFNPMLAQGNSDMPRDWVVNGFYSPGNMQAPMAPQFEVVVTQFGRVQDGCSAGGLGPALRSSFGSNPLLGPVGALGALNPFFALQQNFLGNGFQQRPAGVLANPLVPGSLNVYSTRMSGISKSQLSGAGVALCPLVGNDGQCFGQIPLCCTVAKDQVSATQVYSPVAMGQQGMIGGSGVLGQMGGVAAGFDVNGMGGMQFMDNSGLGVGFVDPNAAMGMAFTDPNAGAAFADPNAGLALTDPNAQASGVSQPSNTMNNAAPLL